MSPSISDAAYRTMVTNARRSLVGMFSQMPRGTPIDVSAVRMWAHGFISALVSQRYRCRCVDVVLICVVILQGSYRSLVGDVEEQEVTTMIREASTLVELVANESWLDWAADLMPTYLARIEEIRAREEEEHRAEAERRAAEEKRRKQFQEQEARRAAQKEKARAEQEAVVGRLSPNSSRAAPRKTSRSSLTSVDVDQLASEDDIAGSQTKGRGKKGQ
jgi:hypothetical protein